MSYEHATAVLDQETREAIDIDRTKGDFTFPERNKFDAGRGLTEKTDRLHLRRQERPATGCASSATRRSRSSSSKPMPTHWATKDLENIDFDKIRYYLSDGEKPKRSWDEVPDGRARDLRASRHSRAGARVPRRRRGPVRLARPPTPT